MGMGGGRRILLMLTLFVIIIVLINFLIICFIFVSSTGQKHSSREKKSLRSRGSEQNMKNRVSDNTILFCFKKNCFEYFG